MNNTTSGIKSNHSHKVLTNKWIVDTGAEIPYTNIDYVIWAPYVRRSKQVKGLQDGSAIKGILAMGIQVNAIIQAYPYLWITKAHVTPGNNIDAKL